MSLSSLSLLCNLPLVENTQLFKRPDNVIGQSEAKHSNASIPFFQRFCYCWSVVHHSQCCTTAAKIGGIPHRAEQWLREKHVSESDLKIWNIHLAISENYTSKVFFHKGCQNWGNSPSSTMTQLMHIAKSQQYTNTHSTMHIRLCCREVKGSNR